MLVNSFQKTLNGIRNWGYAERQFALTSEGRWTAKDAEWNYLDVPHLNEVHSQANSEVLFYGDSCSSSIIQQRVGPLSFASLLTIYSGSRDDLFYSSTVGPFILVVRSTWSDVGDIRGRVVTEYHIFAPRGLAWMLGLVQKLLTRNYRILMSEDLPLRERKGELRLRGFKFKHDEEPHSFLKSHRVVANNVIVSRELEGDYKYSIDLADLMNRGKVLVGPNDIRGLRVERIAEEILIAPRMCMHEGACLDNASLEDGRIRCPWHGRKEAVLARFKAEEHEATVESGDIFVTFEEDEMLIEYRVAGTNGS